MTVHHTEGVLKEECHTVIRVNNVYTFDKM